MKWKIIPSISAMLIAIPTIQAELVTTHGSPGRLDALLLTSSYDAVGTVDIWNTKEEFNLVIEPAEGYLLSKIYIFLNPEPPPPPLPEGASVEPDFGQWPYIVKYKNVPTSEPHVLKLNFAEDLDFEWGHWGARWLEERMLTIGIRVELKTEDATPRTLTAWGYNPHVSLRSQRCGWGDNALAIRYEVQHPKRGKFFNRPVKGLGYTTRTHGGVTSPDGEFWYYPGENILFNIGEVEIGFAEADEQVTPLDIFPSSDPSDPPVANMARLIQTLDADGVSGGSIDLTASTPALEAVVDNLDLAPLDFTNQESMDMLIGEILRIAPSYGLDLIEVTLQDAVAALEESMGSSLMRKNISHSPAYEVDKPKLDIMPVWVPAKTSGGQSATIDYRNKAGAVIESRGMAKPLFVTYTEVQQPNPETDITRSGSDIITAVSLDDGKTWSRFNLSHMAKQSSFTLKDGEKFPGDCRGPQQKIAGDKILISWTSAYARGGKPSFAIRQGDAYSGDDAYAVTDHWGVRGRQGSVDYDMDKDVGDQGIGEIPYYALWTCRGVLVWDGNAYKFPGHAIGDIIWFKPERLTSGRRDAFFVVSGSAKNVGFAVAWQEDPGGLLPGSCKGGGDGWSGATVHKKTDIWYSYISYADFDRIDTGYVASIPDHAADEFGGPDVHAAQSALVGRPKWLVPMSLPVRVSDNNTVNTDNLRVQLDEASGLPVIDPLTGKYTPLEGEEEKDHTATEHEGEGNCGDTTHGEDEEHGGSQGTGGGWGMARYAYMLDGLNLADQTTTSTIWDARIYGDYRPEDPNVRWFRFVNKPGVVKTVAVTEDGRVLDGDTGACRPMLSVMPGGWTILGYEETKGLGEPPEGDHEEVDVIKPEPEDSGKNIIYHSFKFDQPEMVSAGNILNLPALDDYGELIPIYYKDAAGDSTGILRQYKTENARRVRFIAQPKEWLKWGTTNTTLVALYRQGREGEGAPADIFGIRAVLPKGDTGNPYRFELLQRYETGSETEDPNVMRLQRKHMNLSSVEDEEMDPFEMAGDLNGTTWQKVGKWNQYADNVSDESFDNPYSDSKAHRGFIRGDKFIFGYSFTPNWGPLGGDHMDFYVRRSFDGGQTWTTDPNGPEEAVHTVIERNPNTGELKQVQNRYGRGAFEPARNISLLKDNAYTVTDPRLVPPMGPGTLNPQFADDIPDPNNNVFYVAFGTAKVLDELGEPLGQTDTIKDDIYYTRTMDGGSSWLQVPWIVNPDDENLETGEKAFPWPWLAHGTPHQGHAQIRMHPNGTRFYAIWHQWSDGDAEHVYANETGNDIWFRRIDFMDMPE